MSTDVRTGHQPWKSRLCGDSACSRMQRWYRRIGIEQIDLGEQCSHTRPGVAKYNSGIIDVEPQHSARHGLQSKTIGIVLDLPEHLVVAD